MRRPYRPIRQRAVRRLIATGKALPVPLRRELRRLAGVAGFNRANGKVRPPTSGLVEPVDVVYTWVDADDPAWQARRASVQPSGTLAADALDPARTRSRDELRYSLRSVATYADWVRHVWVVTDDQVPDWLRTDHPRLSVVSHREIFTDPDVLPVFNSHAIESQLHHIEGLAEQFLYLNDDFFFGRTVGPELFFDQDGRTKLALSTNAIDCELDPGPLNGAMLAARANRGFIEREFGRTITHRMQHVPYAHRRSSLAAFEREYPDLFARVSRSRFRDATDHSIASDLGHYYAYAHGRAVVDKLSYRYIDIGSPHAMEQLESLLVDRDADCFCVNDVGGYDDIVPDAVIGEFLATYFPVPSPFEIGGPA